MTGRWSAAARSCRRWRAILAFLDLPLGRRGPGMDAWPSLAGADAVPAAPSGVSGWARDETSAQWTCGKIIRFHVVRKIPDAASRVVVGQRSNARPREIAGRYRSAT